MNGKSKNGVNKQVFYWDLRTLRLPKLVDLTPILITFDEQLLKRVDDFRFENRINTGSEAIRRLIDEGLKKYEKKAKE